ncbi:AAA family ATPase [Bengtsoniella intestinalis]|uniref:ATP-dependent DNA helicase n=1 Tax=Bengtsoniella intestinalis TaxID=3073143 RepID=UPI00391F6D00
MSYYHLSAGAKAVLKTLEKHFQNGDAYISKELLWKLCNRSLPDLTQRAFAGYLQELFHENFLHLEGRRLYLKHIWQCEEAAAVTLADILKRNTGQLHSATPATLSVGDVTLTSQQRDAINLACQHRLSCILGGAGTGKSTLIHCLTNIFLSHGKGVVLCAPTGKGARNITTRTTYPARTVHSTLGKTPEDDDFLAKIQWQEVDLVVIDEASMLSLELLAGILTIVNPRCTVVLVGDPNQLLSVGSGNVMADLLALGIPRYTLTTHHRQQDKSSALAYNVEQFNQCHSLADLRFDDSFVFQTDLQTPEKALCVEATKRYLAGENVQVMAPFNASVRQLNSSLQNSVNANPPIKDCLFRILDRVMVIDKQNTLYFRDSL